MKIGIITKPNSKGQIVIPKKIREELDIDKNTHLNIVVRDRGLYVYPIDGIKTDYPLNRRLFLEFLKKNRGRWGPASKEELEKEKKRRALELRASKRRKQAW